MKPNNQSQKSIELISEYNCFDMLSSKKYHECTVRIPQTILMDRGVIKEWIFNSSKIHNSPILKKKRQNLAPLIAIKSICNKQGYGSVTASCMSIIDLKNQVKASMKEKKDYDFVKDKKVVEITTFDNQVFQMTLIELLNQAAEYKYFENMFDEKWKMIQEKISFSKIEQAYEVESVRKNHLIQSKCQKIISINNQLTQGQSKELFQQSIKLSPKKADTDEQKNVQKYKFFDTFLNKRFSEYSERFIQTIEKNFKCVIESVSVKYVINKNREPFFVGAKNLIIKPNKKISDMRDFHMQRDKGFIKMEDYSKLLFIYIVDYVEKGNHNQPNPIKSQNKKCKGKFCDCRLLITDKSSLHQQKSKFPSLIKPYRHINVDMIKTVQKYKNKVIEKMKQNLLISQDYFLLDEDSSDYDSDSDEESKNIKVCENCFLFYENILNLFDLDSFGNLNEKKVPTISFKNYFEQKGRQKIQSHTQVLSDLNKKEQEFQTAVNRIEERKKNSQTPQKVLQRNKIQSLKASSSHSKFLNQKAQRQKSKKAQEDLLLKAQSKHKLAPILNDFKDSTKNDQSLISLTKIQHVNLSERVKPIKYQIKKVPENYQQAKQQLLAKVQNLPSTSDQQFIFHAKKYYIDNLPHITQRRSYSSSYFTNIYEFNNNSPINLEMAFRIKKRPQITMKRLSQLTDYPQIVSKSAFIFQTLICNENTTIPYCVITSKMLGNEDVKDLKYQNIIIIHDLFDSFIEHIGLAKNTIENLSNKRVILFNRPGQSHTIYNEDKPHDVSEFCQVVQKLIYRLSCEKNQRMILDFKNDSFKFIGLGYGGYLLTAYLGYYHYYYNHLSGVLLVNSFKNIPPSYRKLVEQLLQKYLTNDKKDNIYQFLCYNLAIKSTQLQRQELELKQQLNSIKQSDRIYLLQSVISDFGAQPTVLFNQISQLPVFVLHGLQNSVVPKQYAKEFLNYEKDGNQRQNRKLFEADGGHDLCADNINEIQFRFNQFVQFNTYS